MYTYYRKSCRGKCAFIIVAFIILFLLLFDSPLQRFLNDFIN
jgi:hypothetical protein